MKAALLFGVGAALAVVVYGVTDNIAVPSAFVFIGLIGACMAVAFDGDSGSAPAPNPRARAGAAPRSDSADGVVWPQRDADPDTTAWRAAARER